MQPFDVENFRNKIEFDAVEEQRRIAMWGNNSENRLLLTDRMSNHLIESYPQILKFQAGH